MIWLIMHKIKAQPGRVLNINADTFNSNKIVLQILGYNNECTKNKNDWFVLSIDAKEQALDLDILIELKQGHNLKFKLLVNGKTNGFSVVAKIKARLFDNTCLKIFTDTNIRNGVNTGYIEFKERILLLGKDSVLESVPKFGLLPAGIEQIHSMRVFSFSDKELFYLASRGFGRRQALRLAA